MDEERDEEVEHDERETPDAWNRLLGKGSEPGEFDTGGAYRSPVTGLVTAELHVKSRDRQRLTGTVMIVERMPYRTMEFACAAP